jgi:hypothetical protein
LGIDNVGGACESSGRCCKTQLLLRLSSQVLLLLLQQLDLLWGRLLLLLLTPEQLQGLLQLFGAYWSKPLMYIYEPLW